MATSSCVSSPKLHGLNDLPFDVLMLSAEYALVRDVLILATLNRRLRTLFSTTNEAIRTLLTERVCLMHPPALRRTLFDNSALWMYAAVNSIPLSYVMPHNDESDPAASPRRVLSPAVITQWAKERCEEAIHDVRIFADIVKPTEQRLAVSGLLIVLQAVKKRMWDTEVTDLESVRDLLRATIVEKEHDRGWSVLRTILGHAGRMPKKFLMPFYVRVQSTTEATSLSAERRIWKRRLTRAAAIAREYLQLREVLRVVLAVSEVSDHPKAQERYDSMWSALQGTSAMLDAEKRSRQSTPEDLDEVGAAIPIKQGAPGDELLLQVRELNTVTVGGIVSYYFGCMSGNVQRKAFLSALFSMKHLAGAARYESVPFW